MNTWKIIPTYLIVGLCVYVAIWGVGSLFINIIKYAMEIGYPGLFLCLLLFGGAGTLATLDALVCKGNPRTVDTSD